MSSPLHTQTLKRKAMSITQTYYLAHTARGKLSHEAARGDHNLRLLVGHANLLDSLMLELAEAEQEQESWFNQSVRRATPTTPAADKHIQWADAIVEEPEEDWQAEDADSSDSDSDSDFEEQDDEDVQMASAGLARYAASSPRTYTEKEQFEMEEDEEEIEDDGEEDYAVLTLTRTRSRTASAPSPPELSHDDSESSEDEAMPPSPPNTVLPSFSPKHSKTGSHSDKLSPTEQRGFFDDGYYLPSRQQGLVSAINVY